MVAAIWTLAILILAALLARGVRHVAERSVDVDIDALIAAAGAKSRFDGQDDALRIRTVARRQAADALHLSAYRVASGSRAALRRVR